MRMKLGIKKILRRALPLIMMCLMIGTVGMLPVMALQKSDFGKELVLAEQSGSWNSTPYGNNRLDFCGKVMSTVDPASAGIFRINGYTAVCAEHSKTIFGKIGVSFTSPVTIDNENARKALYYGYGGPEDMTGEYITNLNDRYVMSHLAVSSFLGNGGYSGDPNSDYGKVVKKFMEDVASKEAPGDNFISYLLYPEVDPGTIQGVAYWEFDDTRAANIVVNKIVGIDRHLSDLSSEYTLENAVYTVFSDEELKNVVGHLTVNPNGLSSPLQVESGKYYIRESKPSNGFDYDKNVYEVNAKSGKTSTVVSNETPAFLPADVILRKLDYIENKAVPELEGAEFTFKYYNKVTDNTEDLEPLKTWVFKTDRKGEVILSDGYKVSGDELFKNSKGDPVMLIGTYEITETKAPSGYQIDESKIVSKVTYKVDDESGYASYDVPTVYNSRLKNKPTVPKPGEGTKPVNTSDSDKLLILTGMLFISVVLCIRAVELKRKKV